MYLFPYFTLNPWRCSVEIYGSAEPSLRNSTLKFYMNSSIDYLAYINVLYLHISEVNNSSKRQLNILSYILETPIQVR